MSGSTEVLKLNDAAEDKYFIPESEQKIFGAGIKRKRVNFVPAETNASSSVDNRREVAASNAVGARYLSVVLPGTGSPGEETLLPKSSIKSESTIHTSGDKDTLCEICKLPLGPSTGITLNSYQPHESSLAHQVCLLHSHPPSHLDRTRQGLKYLSSYGWDPDSRRGLGATGQGRLAPIKPQPKNDTVGLGVCRVPRKAGQSMKEAKPKRLDAKETRKVEEEARRKRRKLQDLFCQSEEVERYLRAG